MTTNNSTYARSGSTLPTPQVRAQHEIYVEDAQTSSKRVPQHNFITEATKQGQHCSEKQDGMQK